MSSRECEVRRVLFSPPRETPTIYWMLGHVRVDEFMALHSLVDNAPQPESASQIKHGWGSRKLSGISIYLSDTPLANFEPITYWIPTDAA